MFEIMDSNKTEKKCINREQPYGGVVLNGFVAIAIAVLFFAIALSSFVFAYNAIGGVFLALTVLMMSGFVMLEPNQAVVLIFFGKYRGTFSDAGFYWVNPFMSKKKLSLRIDNLDIDPIKVNDKDGNPVLIGMVLVWKLKDTYKAVFDLDSSSLGIGKSVFHNFVNIQGNAALREVAGLYAYDNDGGDGALTLRSGGVEINELLEKKINDRLSIAGIEVVEARINYLAYAPEIAAVMLRRQQAAAIIQAREKIVEGAVSTVKMALEHLEKDGVVTLDNDRKAQMVGNLLVVLCADESAQPVIPTV